MTGVFLTWILLLGCEAVPLRLHDAYLGPGTGIGYYEPGERPVTRQTSFYLAPWKPEPGCAIAWWLAAEIAECTPDIETVDGEPMWSEEPQP